MYRKYKPPQDECSHCPVASAERSLHQRIRPAQQLEGRMHIAVGDAGKLIGSTPGHSYQSARVQGRPLRPCASGLASSAWYTLSRPLEKP